ncbi:MAG: hypothetical protein GXP61_00715 [Epsilonproteobacteria bacterium]|nr:hypothetical protein [Campylobacterota bacterium]
MNAWFTCNLGDAMLAGEMLEEVKILFLSAFEKQNKPEDMAVFFRHESEGRLQCEVKVYFPPSASTIAHEFDAISCRKPMLQGLGLLVGSKNAKSILW